MAAKIYDPAFPDDNVAGTLDVGDEVRGKEALRAARALQTAIFNSVNFSSIATDANGVIQIFNVGAERMLGYTAAEVMNKIVPRPPPPTLWLMRAGCGGLNGEGLP